MFFHHDDRPAALNQHEGLLQYLSTSPIRPATVTPQQLKSMDDAERATYNRARMVHLSGGILIGTPQLLTAQKMLASSFAVNSGRNSGHAGLMISGTSTVGKTTTTKALMRWTFEKYRTQFPEFRQHGHMPVVYVEVPPASTAKLLMTAFADFFGLSIRRSETMDSIRRRVVAALKDAHTQLIVVDELHNLASRNVGNGDSVDVLKSLHNDVAATFVYAGIDLLGGSLLAGARGQQIAGRFAALEMRPFNTRTTEERHLWVQFLTAYENQLTLTDLEPNSIRSMHDYLYRRTGGSIGSLSRLLSSAAIEAITNPTLPETITEALLDSITIDHTAEAHRRSEAFRPLIRHTASVRTSAGGSEFS